MTKVLKFDGKITGGLIYTPPSKLSFTSMFPLSNDKDVIDKFGLPLNDNIQCPACNKEANMVVIIAHLNNVEGQTNNNFDRENGVHGWTFKQIGQWLKELGY